jgi:hypothetical protein
MANPIPSLKSDAAGGSVNPSGDPKKFTPSKKPLALFGVQEGTQPGSDDGGAAIIKYRAVRYDPASKLVEPLKFPYGQPMERRWASTEASNACYREAMGFGSRAQHALVDKVPEIGQTNTLDRSKLVVGKEAGQ